MFVCRDSLGRGEWISSVGKVRVTKTTVRCHWFIQAVEFICLFVYGLCLHSMWSRVYVMVERPSVHLSVCPISRQQQRRPAGLLLSTLWAGDSSGCHAAAGASCRQQCRRSTVLSSKRRQRRVESRWRRLVHKSCNGCHWLTS